MEFISDLNCESNFRGESIFTLLQAAVFSWLFVSGRQAITSLNDGKPLGSASVWARLGRSRPCLWSRTRTSQLRATEWAASPWAGCWGLDVSGLIPG